MPKPLPIPPPGWGSDPLTAYFDHAHMNRWATFVQEEKAFELLKRVNTWLDAHRDGLFKTQLEIPASLFMRAHLLFQTTCELATSGALYASMPIQRASLECAAYVLWLAKDPLALKIWLERDECSVTKKSARNHFTFGNTVKAIRRSDTGLAHIYSELYERTIDFGAHPNPLGIWSSANVSSAGPHVMISQIGLHNRGPELTAALKSTAQTGVFLVRIAQLVWPERVSLLGLYDEMWKLRRAC